MSFLSALLPLMLFSYSPKQVRLSFGDSPSEMFVVFSTQHKYPHAKVQWSPIDSNSWFYDYEARCDWRSFNTDEKDPESRLLHVCIGKMTGLIEGQRYVYRVGQHGFGWSSKFEFKAQEASANGVQRFLVYADIGNPPEMTITVDQMLKEVEKQQYEAMLVMGDLAYNINDDEGKVGDEFLEEMQPLTARLPFMICQGNHEGPEHDATNHYINRFQLPGNYSNFFYSFNSGYTHFLVYNAELVIHPHSESYPMEGLKEIQKEFIIQDLQAVDRNQYPWVVAYSHRPYYCSPDWTVRQVQEDVPFIVKNNDCLERAELIREEFEELFYQLNVDLVINGHKHDYERLAPAYRNETMLSQEDGDNMHYNPNGPVQIISGIAGQMHFYSPVSHTPLPWSRAGSSDRGYGRLTVFNETHLLYEQVLSGNGEMMDYVWVVKAS